MPLASAASLSASAREAATRVLDHVLRDECSLSAVMREYRWHLTGPHIYSLNRLFEEQRQQLDAWLGKVIERTRVAGGAALDTLEELVKAPQGVAAAGLPPGTMIGDLVVRHERMAEQLRQDAAAVPDPVTVEILHGLREFHETTAWMLRMLPGGESSARTS